MSTRHIVVISTGSGAFATAIKATVAMHECGLLHGVLNKAHSNVG